MLNSVNFLNLNRTNGFGNQLSAEKRQKNQAGGKCFGSGYYTDYYPEYYQDYSPHQIKDGLLNLTNGILGIVGFNAALFAVQNFVNGKILVGKINKHYTDKIHNDNQLVNLASKMLEDNGLDKKVTFVPGKTGEAYYSALGNRVVIGGDKASALFHEIGHAIIENKSGILKTLQDHRGHYTVAALALYALMSQRRQKDAFGDKRQGLGTKIANFLSRGSLLVPLLAFSPELITEFKASQYGLKFLKGKGVDKALYKNIKNSYRACFATYLFIPVSIILMELLFSGIEKEVRKQKQRRTYADYY